MNELKPELLTVGKLFDDNYLVPIYQRNYAWQTEQIEQLITDIQDAISGNAESYFLGNLIVTKKGDVFEVIDGQQRLTTLYLLLTFLKQSHDQHHEGRLRYESRAKATEALRRAGNGTLMQDSATDEDNGIHEAFKIIQQFFEKKENKLLGDARAGFATFLKDKVALVRAALPPKTDLNRYFEIMNTRGQQLKQVDIVKARLMSVLSDDAERACFAWIWDACADMNSYVQMSLTRGNTELRKTIFGDGWSWLTANDFSALLAIHKQLSVAFSAAGESLGLDEALTKYLSQTETGSLSEDEGNERFSSTIGFSTFLLHILKIKNRDEGENEGELDDKRLIKSFQEAIDKAKEQNEKAEWVRDFAFTLLKCRNLFDSFILKRQYTATNGDDGDWSLQRLKGRESNTPGYVHTFATANNGVAEDGEADSNTQDVLLLQSMLRITYTSPRTMHWITEVLKWLLEQKPEAIKHTELAELLRDYARNKVKESFFAEPQPQGFSISRIVFTYLDYLLLPHDASRQAFKFHFRTSIEHFYPQHPDNEQTGLAVSGNCINLLGNLALVSVSANSKFSNNLPAAKAASFQNTIMQSPKLQKMAACAKSWNDESVEKHHVEMVELLDEDIKKAENKELG